MIMWLYENRATYNDFLRAEVVAELDMVMSDARISGKKKKSEARKVVVQGWLSKMVRKTIDDGLNQCPIDMTKMTYEVVGTYMAQRKDGQDKYLGKGTYCGIRSGVINLFTMSNLSPPPRFREQVSVLLKGFRRTITEQKVIAGESLEEGKEVMSFACYKLLCEKFMQGNRDEYNFAHLFLTLEWNLMARADSIVNLSLNNFQWNDDALIVYLRKTKTDQEGSNGKPPTTCTQIPSTPASLLCSHLVYTYYQTLGSSIAGPGPGYFRLTSSTTGTHRSLQG